MTWLSASKLSASNATGKTYADSLQDYSGSMASNGIPTGPYGFYDSGGTVNTAPPGTDAYSIAHGNYVPQKQQLPQVTDEGILQTGIGYGQQALNNEGRAGPQAQAAQVGALQQAHAAQVDTGQYNQDRAAQQMLGQQFGQTAGGNGPSLANMGQSQALQQMAAQQAAMGRGDPLAQRNAIYGAAGQAQGIAGQSAQARMQEMGQAQGQAAGVYGGLAGQDIGLAGQNAGFAQQANLANVGAANQAQFANAGFGQQVAQANQQSNLTQEQQDQQNAQFWQNLIAEQRQSMRNQAVGQAQLAAQQNQFNTQQGLGIAGGVGQGVESFAQMSEDADKNAAPPTSNYGNAQTDYYASGVSDQRAKTRIRSGERTVSRFLEELCRR